MKITVIGCGRWGTFIAWYLDRIGYEVTLYGRSSGKNFQMLKETRKNSFLTIPDTLHLSDSLDSVIESELVVISVNSQGFRGLLEEVSSYDINNKTFVLCMKGIEISTGKRLSEVAEEFLSSSNKIAVWLGPGHVQEFVRRVPNCMVIDSKDETTKKNLVETFSSDLIRFYYGEDLIGNEIGAAYKNVIGIAAGALDGMGLTSLKGALMARGCREVSRLIKKMGGNELSAYGLCHLGDYEATVFSEHSHNRMFGEKFVLKKPFTKLAEGYYTTRAIDRLAKKYDVDLPINSAICRVLYEESTLDEEMQKLFLRPLKPEFY